MVHCFNFLDNHCECLNLGRHSDLAWCLEKQCWLYLKEELLNLVIGTGFAELMSGYSL